MRKPLMLYVAFAGAACVGTDGLAGGVDDPDGSAEDAALVEAGPSDAGATTATDGAVAADSSPSDANVDTAACDLSLPQNCGACGVDCSGGTCAAGICTLANTVYKATRSIAIANGVVYRTSQYGLEKCAASGCIASGGTPLIQYPPDPVMLPQELEFEPALQALYWVNYENNDPNGGLYRTQVSDGGTVYMNPVKQTQQAVALTLGATRVFFASIDLTGGVFWCPKTGCPDGGATLIPDAGTNATAVLALSTGGVAMGVDGFVRVCADEACSGGPLPLAGMQGSILALAEHADALYWSAMFPSKGIMRRPFDSSSPPAQVVQQPQTPVAILIHNGTMYWALPGTGSDVAGFQTTDGLVRKCVLPTCSPVIDVATGQPNPSDLATDGVALYWVNGGNTGYVESIGSLRKAPL